MIICFLFFSNSFVFTIVIVSFFFGFFLSAFFGIFFSSVGEEVVKAEVGVTLEIGGILNDVHTELLSTITCTGGRHNQYHHSYTIRRASGCVSHKESLRRLGSQASESWTRSTPSCFQPSRAQEDRHNQCHHSYTIHRASGCESHKQGLGSQASKGLKQGQTQRQ